MATGRPACPLAKQERVGNTADIYFAQGLILHLGMALQAKVGIILDEQLSVNRAVGVVTDGATFAHRLVLKNEGPSLLAMTFRARFILPLHGQTAGGFKDICSVRVVALNAIHPAFKNGMMLRQVDL